MGGGEGRDLHLVSACSRAADPEDGNGSFIRIQGRVDEHLHGRRDRKHVRQLEAVALLLEETAPAAGQAAGSRPRRWRPGARLDAGSRRRS